MTSTKQDGVQVGDRVPDMVLADEAGDEVRLRGLEGSRVVLYFYPKDDTSGCTTQACGLRDEWDELRSLDDVVVYGVSPDDAASHRRFRDKHELPFHLLVDEEHRLADALGFWVEKKMYGRSYMGVERSTVVVGADGTVEAVRRKVKPGEHAAWLHDVLAGGDGAADA